MSYLAAFSSAWQHGLAVCHLAKTGLSPVASCLPVANFMVILDATCVNKTEKVRLQPISGHNCRSQEEAFRSTDDKLLGSCAYKTCFLRMMHHNALA
jgi:hypothetical protein